jgi:hypothetical protein
MHIRIGALLALILSTQVASAQQCPVPAGADPKLVQVDSALRLKYLQDALDRDTGRAVAWRWGWVGAYGVIAVAQFGLSGLKPPESMPHFLTERYVGGVQAAIALIPPLVLPLHVGYDAPAFAAKVKAAAPGDTCNLIEEGEKLLREDAHNEAFGVSWVTHVVNIVYNAVFFVILEFGYHDLLGAALAGGLGAVLGEVQIFTQPASLPAALRDYQAAKLGPPVPPAVTLRVTPGGVQMTF